MIAFIEGNIISRDENTVVISNNSIGYEIFVSQSTIALLEQKSAAGLFTHMQVKEDGISLFGFISADEKKMFLNLINHVSGIGCKTAINILSGMSVRDLAICIAGEDAAMLSKVKGVGQKTAERIILELKEKVSKEEIKNIKTQKISGGDNPAVTEAYTALMALAMKRAECIDAVKAAVAGGAVSTEEIIRAALRFMGR